MAEYKIDLRKKVVLGCRAAASLCKFLQNSGKDVFVKVEGEWICGKDVSVMSIMAFILPKDFIELKCECEDIFHDLETAISDYILDEKEF